jgi:hypothetical protein
MTVVIINLLQVCMTVYVRSMGGFSAQHRLW